MAVKKSSLDMNSKLIKIVFVYLKDEKEVQEIKKRKNRILRKKKVLFFLLF